MTILGGLDIHRGQVTFDYVDTRSGEVFGGQIADPHRHRFREWLDGLPDRDCEFVMEGCTGWRYLVEELEAAGMRARVADPAEAAALKGKKKRAKTDRADAKHLRMLLVDDRVPDSWIAPAHVDEVRALGRLYLDLRNCRASWNQRVHATLFHHGAPRVSAELFTEAGQSQARTYGAELPEVNRHAIETSLTMISSVSTEMVTTRKRLQWIGRHQIGARAIGAVYGIGELTGAVTWAELGDVSRFRSSSQAVRHSGLDITVYESDANRAPGRITRQGPPALRWALFEAAMSATKPASPDHPYYQQVSKRVHHKAAVLSVARKHARRCYHILKDLGPDALAEPNPPRATPPPLHT
ncbi:MAG: IS110 family transposase [Acidimicrobiales bacterium]|nr:IS110 family transposase [Acidimicrobiales bacterium]